MYARVNEFTGTPEQLEASRAATTEVTKRLVPEHGALGTYYMLDREEGKALGITFWETEEDMRASEATAAEVRAMNERDYGVVATNVRRYEVVFDSVHVPAGHAV